MQEFGCPYSRFNWKTMRERCTLTAEITEGNIICDYGFEKCPKHIKAVADGVPVPPHEPLPSSSQLEKILSRNYGND